MTIEERLVRLEEIVEALEGDQLDLAESLALFEEGVQCLRAAAGTLTEAESRVKRLIELADGAFEEQEMEDD